MNAAEFSEYRKNNIEGMKRDAAFADLSKQWLIGSAGNNYSYHFDWMGMPIIQYPQDMVATQEIIWKVKPDVVIETGVARGGSIICWASMLELIGNGKVIGVDIDIRAENRERIESHPMFKRVELVEGSSIAGETLEQVRKVAGDAERVLVILDSNHTHEHVIEELRLYSPFVKKGSYLIVFDTVIEDVPDNLHNDRPWGPGNNPKTAVWEFLKECDRFEVDKEIETKLGITVAPDGYLHCLR